MQRRILVINILILTTYVAGSSVDKDLSITWKQKRVLDEFRDLVAHQVPHKYMQEDIYLIRWLRARNFDIRAAANMLKANLEWREKNGMDNILEEDFSDMQEDYAYYINGFDYEGKPVAFFDLGSYDLRAAGVSGRMPRLIRYLDRYLEQVTSKVREMREVEGKNVTQYSFVVNMDGYNIIQHFCLQCLPMVLNFLNTYENYFPGACDLMFLVNTPAAFEAVLTAIKGAASPTTRDALQVFGTNSAKWKPILYKAVPRDQLPRQVGGTADYAE